MKKIFNYIIASFDTNNAGASARKLSAFALMNCIIYLHYKYVDMVNSYSFLVADLVALFMLLGIVTVEQIILFKNGKR